MKINDELKVGLQEKFVDNAEVGDVIKVRYVAGGRISHLLLVEDIPFKGLHFIPLDGPARVETHGKATKKDLYQHTFVKLTGDSMIDTLEVYKNSVLTIK